MESRFGFSYLGQLKVCSVENERPPQSINLCQFGSIRLLERCCNSKKFRTAEQVCAKNTSGGVESWWLESWELSHRYSADIISGRSEELVYISFINEQVGFGAFALKGFSKGDFVGEYIGTVMSGSGGGAYSCAYVKALPYAQLLINSEKSANWFRFVNHSSTKANLIWKEIFAAGVYHIVGIAARDIAKHEQLLIDYGTSYWQTSPIQPVEF